MGQKIYIKRGSQAQIGTVLLVPAELGFTMDTHRLYIGNGIGNILLAEAHGLHRRIVTVSASTYVPDDTDFTILCDTSGGNVRINLRPAAECVGRILCCKKIDSNNRMRVEPSGAEKIDGKTRYNTTKLLKSYLIQSDGVGWWSVATA
jgi:hypothetical protein